ncbi:hypothetical protein EW145_g6500 [Phellinidium pouzarii]|uniref:Uncharacterized protein n=1 Tax=Phellinidium pouzarii TaxID=167371 RepID=A0A4S4KWE6_9AGAM|nr:hypothetical protein EW145_g6500 [Phellinidium pouzarii]
MHISLIKHAQIVHHPRPIRPQSTFKECIEKMERDAAATMGDIAEEGCVPKEELKQQENVVQHERLDTSGDPVLGDEKSTLTFSERIIGHPLKVNPFAHSTSVILFVIIAVAIKRK